MADQATKFQPATPIPDAFRTKYAGGDSAGIDVVDRQAIAIVQVFAKKGKTGEVEKKLKIASTPGKVSETSGFTAIPLSPGQWMLVSGKGYDGSFCAEIAAALEGIGYASEQSDSRAVLRVSGARVRDLMERGCRLDLHPSVAAKGFCAQTQMAQMGVLIHQVDDAPSYDLYVYAGFALDFAEWLAHSALQYGVGFATGR